MARSKRKTQRQKDLERMPTLPPRIRMTDEEIRTARQLQSTMQKIGAPQIPGVMPPGTFRRGNPGHGVPHHHEDLERISFDVDGTPLSRTQTDVVAWFSALACLGELNLASIVGMSVNACGPNERYDGKQYRLDLNLALDVFPMFMRDLATMVDNRAFAERMMMYWTAEVQAEDSKEKAGG